MMKNIARSKVLTFMVIGAVQVAFLFTAGDLLVPGAVRAEVVDRIVAVVNDDIILLSELNRELKPYSERIASAGYSPAKMDQMLYKIRTDMLDRMIDEKLTDQEIKRSKIFVTEKEIDGAIERLKEANYYTDEEFRKTLANQGLDMEEYRKRLKEQILRTRLVNLEVKSKIVITKEDIHAYYEKHRDRYASEKKYHLRNLIMKLPPQADETQKLEAEKRMTGILARLKAGQPFDKSGTAGRDLGLIPFRKLSPQLQSILKDMKPGAYTPVLDTDQGYQIFFVQDIESAPGKPLDAVHDEIERQLYEEIVNEKFRSWLNDLRKRSAIRMIK